MTKALMVDEKESFDVGGLSICWRSMGTRQASGSRSSTTRSRRTRSLEMRFESVPDLCQRFGLTFPAL
jgi:hypothetical protein